MRVRGESFRSIEYDAEADVVRVVDQTVLPHEFRVVPLENLDSVCEAIRTMRVRGAPLIGAAAAYGLALALGEDPSPAGEERAARALVATRPTAVNLRWAVERVRNALANLPAERRAAAALDEAGRICEEDVECCRRIGEHGLSILRGLAGGKAKDEPLHVLTHCNAGWLATVDWGTALAPVYRAHDEGIPVHVWVDETRPRGQGASLTAWELAQHGVPHTVIADAAAGHVLQSGRADLVLVGSDRTTAAGDVCNKIGTYPLALAARESAVPFYACVPVSSIDWRLEDGSAIPIEERDPGEVTRIRGRDERGRPAEVSIVPEGTRAANWAFDLTPARLVTGIVTEHGVFPASREGLGELAAELPAARGGG